MGDGVAGYSITNIAHGQMVGRDNFNLSLLYRTSRHRFEKGGSRAKTMQNNIEGAKSGMISLLTGLLGLYFTAAMWVQLEDSLQILIGGPMAVVVTTTMFLIFQSKKQEREIGLNASYDLNESFLNDNTDPLGVQKGRNPVAFIVMLYLFIVMINEAAGIGLFF